jgi:hypothetical protein
VIHFKCPVCAAGLRVADEKAGKLTLCPNCRRKVRAPTRGPGQVEVVEELPVVEDEEEEEIQEVEAAEDDTGNDERPRLRRRIASRPAPPERHEDEESRREIVTRNRIMGVIGTVLGLAFTIGSLISWTSGRVDMFNPLNTPYNAGGCFGLLLGVLMLVVGVIYAIRG